MLTAILGRKVGMTQIFTESGNSIPVTVIEAGPCVVTQIKTVATDGYEAVQIGFGTKKHATRPEMGHLGHNLPQLEAQKKRRQEERSKTRQAARARGESGVAAETDEATNEDDAEQTNATARGGAERRRGRAGGGLGPFQVLREVETRGDDEVSIGQVVDTEIFGVGDFVDIIGTSKGKGFQGVMKRHGFHGGQRTHGQSDRLRAPGSIGAGTTPGRVLKGTRMGGRMGNDRITVKALEVVQSDAERNLLVIKGSIPGANGGIVLIRKQKVGY
jgi:large subunit ribosomal protein L3